MLMFKNNLKLSGGINMKPSIRTKNKTKLYQNVCLLEWKKIAEVSDYVYDNWYLFFLPQCIRHCDR